MHGVKCKGEKAEKVSRKGPSQTLDICRRCFKLVRVQNRESRSGFSPAFREPARPDLERGSWEVLSLERPFSQHTYLRVTSHFLPSVRADQIVKTEKVEYVELKT